MKSDRTQIIIHGMWCLGAMFTIWVVGIGLPTALRGNGPQYTVTPNSQTVDETVAKASSKTPTLIEIPTKSEADGQSTPLTSWTYGSSMNDVLKLEGKPDSVSHHASGPQDDYVYWNFKDNSYVLFLDGKVNAWVDYGQLKHGEAK
jgi:hypothetical protein